MMFFLIPPPFSPSGGGHGGGRPLRLCGELLPILIKNQLYLSSLFSLIGLNLAFTKHTINV